MIEKGMKHNEIINVIAGAFEDHFVVETNVQGWSHYRGCRVSCRADLMLYDRANGFLFGVEVKSFYTFNVEWMKETMDQMISYNNAAFKMPNHLNRPLHPHAFFLASPLTNVQDQYEGLQNCLDLLPRGLGLLRMIPDEVNWAPDRLDSVDILHMDLQLTSGEKLWSNHLGYHVNVDELLSPQVGSQKVVHEAVGMKLEGDDYRKNYSLSSQNRCEQDFR